MLPRLRLPALAFVPLLKGGSRHMAPYWAPAGRCRDPLESADFGRFDAIGSLKPAARRAQVRLIRRAEPCPPSSLFMQDLKAIHVDDEDERQPG